jgi:MFS family permease
MCVLFNAYTMHSVFVCCCLFGLAFYWTTVLLSNVGKFGASAAFGVFYVWSTELFPTPVRTSGVGLTQMGGRMGGIVAPYIAELVRIFEFYRRDICTHILPFVYAHNFITELTI